jgi:hypothetical protein
VGVVNVDMHLAEAIAAVRRELRNAQDEGKDDDIKFLVGPVEMEFQVALSKEGGGNAKVKVYVLELGASAAATRSETHSVRITMTPHAEGGSALDIRDRRSAGR